MGVPSPFLAACFEIVLAERAAQQRVKGKSQCCFRWH